MPLSAANKKNSILRGTWQRSFAVTLFFVTMATLLFWLDSFRAYESEVRVLVIGKSPNVAADQVVENFAELSKSLSFYERVLEGSDLIDDDFQGYSQDKRKELWNETVSVKRSDKSGVLIITAKQERAEKAKLLSEETVKTLFAVASFYYNIKTDIDMRVVDEPITKTVLRDPIQYVLVSFASAFGVTAFFFGLLSVVPLLFGERKAAPAPSFEVGAAVPFIDPRKFVPARPTNLAFESSHEAQESLEKVGEPAPSQEAARSEAVSDERLLPGMDVEELPFQFEETYEEEKEELPQGMLRDEEEIPEVEIEEVFPETVSEEVAKQEEAPVKHGEPTVEEYKRRLNELLSGGK
jgi:capsular polysaccharide biosynthesis protein